MNQFSYCQILILLTSVYLDEQNQILILLILRYVTRRSFYPTNVFKSFTISLIIRTVERNSSDGSVEVEMAKTAEHLVKSGYNTENQLDPLPGCIISSQT